MLFNGLMNLFRLLILLHLTERPAVRPPVYCRRASGATGWARRAVAGPGCQIPPRAPTRPHRLERHGDVRVRRVLLAAGPRRSRGPRLPRGRERPISRTGCSTCASCATVCSRRSRGASGRPTCRPPIGTARTATTGATRRGRQYRIYCRSPPGADVEQVILDVNAVAEGHEFCDAANPGRQPGRAPPGVRGRHRRAPPLHHPFPRSRPRGNALPDVIPDVVCNRGLGQRQSDAVLHPPGSDHAAALPGAAAHTGARRRGGRAGLRGARRHFQLRASGRAARSATS